MNRVLSSLVIASITSATGLAQPQPVPPAPSSPPAPVQAQQGSPQQVEEWVKQMRQDGMKMIGEGDAALAKGDEKRALDRYTAAFEIHKAAFSEEERKAIADKITGLRTKLGVADPTQPTPPPPKEVDLSNPEVASKRTDAMRLLSEAEQYLEEGKYQDAGRLFTRLSARYRPVLLAEEEQRVTQGLMTARERLGLPPMPAGETDVMPYVVRTGDDEIDSLCQLMSGTFATDAKTVSESNPRLVLGSGAVEVDGLSNAVYFEVAREDDRPNPFRQGIFTIYRTDNQMRLRVLDIPAPGQRSALAGLWAATDVFPKLPLDSLAINADLVLARNTDGSGYTARTSGRVPTTRGGAVLMTSIIKVSADGVSIDDRGFDASGNEVWRSGSSDGVVFTREAPPRIVSRRDSGLVVLDLVPGAVGGEGLKRGGEIAMHFSYWSINGTLVGTSRFADRPPQRVRYPINFIPGLDEGLEGLTPGTRRRFVIPPELAWGAQGNNWQVPPNTPVVFDVECLWVQAPLAPPPMPAAPGEQGPPAAPQQPAGGGH